MFSLLLSAVMLLSDKGRIGAAVVSLLFSIVSFLFSVVSILFPVVLNVVFHCFKFRFLLFCCDLMTVPLGVIVLFVFT